MASGSAGQEASLSQGAGRRSKTWTYQPFEGSVSSSTRVSDSSDSASCHTADQCSAAPVQMCLSAAGVSCRSRVRPQRGGAGLCPDSGRPLQSRALPSTAGADRPQLCPRDTARLPIITVSHSQTPHHHGRSRPDSPSSR